MSVCVTESKEGSEENNRQEREEKLRKNQLLTLDACPDVIKNGQWLTMDNTFV